MCSYGGYQGTFNVTLLCHSMKSGVWSLTSVYWQFNTGFFPSLSIVAKSRGVIEYLIMSRAALPGCRGKKKDTWSNGHDRSSECSREPKVNQVFESADGPTIQGGGFSADGKNPELQLWIFTVVAVLSLLAHYFLFSHMYHNIHGKIDDAAKHASNIKKLVPNAQEMNGLREKINEMSRKYSEFIMTKETDDSKIEELHVSVEEGEKKLAIIREELGKLKKNTSKALAEYAEHKDKIKEIKEQLDVIQPNTFNKGSCVMAFMILTVMVCVLAVAVFNIYQRGSSTEPVHTNGRTQAKRNTKDMGSNDVLRRIPQSPNLQSGVCIISYDEARAGFHRELLDSANIPKCDVKSHVIRRHDQILELPRCKVYLMCTEFSERHVIIEEPGLGLGDLHRTTYYAVKKLGGCLIILYTKDPGSRKLRNQAKQALYNTDIYCVKKQQELSDLEQNNGFYSTYDKLSEHQKTVLRQKIVDNMT
ncbi:uncharacterized protein LOC132756789 [Ruditapes philippinarum]|uniref:uncharacterized protein LOC132756789 n=1 Tax=Ruditapes philippinarum TaxID=129788 RepID=UPI00295B3FBD|nr:uncharacterized protein LOC132756789 [Ruditapes philippinarum]